MTPRIAAITRSACFIAFALYIIGGPIYRQGFGGNNRYLPKWRMYGSKGIGMVDARFFTEGESGDRVRIFRGDLPSFSTAKKRRNHPVKGRSALRPVTRKLCASELVDGGPLYVVARQVRRDGWHELDSGEVDRCHR